MKKILFITAVALVLMGCNKRPEHTLEIKEEPGVFIKYGNVQQKITEDGTLYLIRATSKGVMVMEPATLDDCRRVLEENGQG